MKNAILNFDSLRMPNIACNRERKDHTHSIPDRAQRQAKDNEIEKQAQIQVQA